MLEINRTDEYKIFMSMKYSCLLGFGESKNQAFTMFVDSFNKYTETIEKELDSLKEIQKEIDEYIDNDEKCGLPFYSEGIPE